MIIVGSVFKNVRLGMVAFALKKTVYTELNMDSGCPENILIA